MKTVPYPSIQRFPLYLEVIKQMQLSGIKTVSAADIARRLGFTNIQVRKDIGYTGITGKPKIGYGIKELEKIITSFLGWQNSNDAVLVGVGALGSALLGYKGFEDYGLNIITGFDVNKKIVGKKIHGKKILHIDDLESQIKQLKVSIGILTVNQNSAQQVTDLMVKAGIKGIWNFSSENLKVPDDIVVQRENLSASLALLSVKLSHKFKTKQ